MKRLLVCFFALLMIISSVSVCAFADAQPKLTVGNVETQPGQTVLVPIVLSSNKGIWGVEFNVKFDTAIFEVLEVVHNGEVFEKGDFVIGPADFGSGYVRFVISAMNHLYDNNTNNGTVCYIKLKTSEKAQIYKYPFEIEETFACDVDAKEVSVTSDNGSVNVVKNTSEKPIEVKDAEVLVQAKDNKVIDEQTIETKVVVENVTDKNGEEVTDKNGQKQTVTKVVEVTQKESEKNLSENDTMIDVTPKEDDVYGDPFTFYDFVKIAAVVVCSAGIIAVVVILIKKKKK